MSSDWLSWRRSETIHWILNLTQNIKNCVICNIKYTHAMNKKMKYHQWEIHFLMNLCSRVCVKQLIFMLLNAFVSFDLTVCYVISFFCHSIESAIFYVHTASNRVFKLTSWNCVLFLFCFHFQFTLCQFGFYFCWSYVYSLILLHVITEKFLILIQFACLHFLHVFELPFRWISIFLFDI